VEQFGLIFNFYDKSLCVSLPDDLNLMPVLSNGHVGFGVFSDSVYMNALYNGHAGLSHRARIPNYANIQLTHCRMSDSCKYTFNMKYGFFMTEMNVEDQFKVTHLIYAHRYYDRAIINQFYIQRMRSKGESALNILLLHLIMTDHYFLLQVFFCYANHKYHFNWKVD
jgi:hypothetical protein